MFTSSSESISSSNSLPSIFFVSEGREATNLDLKTFDPTLQFILLGSSGRRVGRSELKLQNEYFLYNMNEKLQIRDFDKNTLLKLEDAFHPLLTYVSEKHENLKTKVKYEHKLLQKVKKLEIKKNYTLSDAILPNNEPLMSLIPKEVQELDLESIKFRLGELQSFDSNDLDEVKTQIGRVKRSTNLSIANKIERLLEILINVDGIEKQWNCFKSRYSDLQPALSSCLFVIKVIETYKNIESEIKMRDQCILGLKNEFNRFRNLVYEVRRDENKRRNDFLEGLKTQDEESKKVIRKLFDLYPFLQHSVPEITIDIEYDEDVYNPALLSFHETESVISDNEDTTENLTDEIRDYNLKTIENLKQKLRHKETEIDTLAFSLGSSSQSGEELKGKLKSLTEEMNELIAEKENILNMSLRNADKWFEESQLTNDKYQEKITSMKSKLEQYKQMEIELTQTTSSLYERIATLEKSNKQLEMSNNQLREENQNLELRSIQKENVIAKLSKSLSQSQLTRISTPSALDESNLSLSSQSDKVSELQGIVEELNNRLQTAYEDQNNLRTVIQKLQEQNKKLAERFQDSNNGSK